MLGKRSVKIVRKFYILLIIISMLGTSFLCFSFNAFPDDDVSNPATITIFISVFDCEHGNAIPNVDVTLSNPLSGSEIKSATTDSDGKLMVWFEDSLEGDEDPEEKALNTDIELEKPGSEYLVREFDEYVLTSNEFEATIEKDFCMKGVYKDWKLYESINFPNYAENNCTNLQQIAQRRRCSEAEVGKRISPPCTISWQAGDTQWKRECALICTNKSGYQHLIELRCSEAFQEEDVEEEN